MSPAPSARGRAGGVAPALLCAVALAGYPAVGADAALQRIYTFSELLHQAEVVVLAEVEQGAAGAARLRVLDWVKAPGAELEMWNAGQRLGRAAQLLKAEADNTAATPAKDLPPPAPDDRGPPILLVAGPGPALPRAGTQGLFFLWDRQQDVSSTPLAYRLSHPQCLYDAALAAEVKAELGRPRGATRRTYLREWDRRMAEQLARRQEDQVLRGLAAGNIEKGMRLTLAAARRVPGAPNSFLLTARLENSRDAAQAVYEGLLGGFGARVRRKDAPPEAALVLRAADLEITAGVDTQVLGLVDAGDFVAVPKQGALAEGLLFDSRRFPALAELNGEFLVSAFYASVHDGKGIEDLPGVPWTGMLVSNELLLTFGAGERAGPRAPPREP